LKPASSTPHPAPKIMEYPVGYFENAVADWARSEPGRKS